MKLTELKKYPFTEAIYIDAFHISTEDLENKPQEEVIADYAHLQENVEEALETLSERERAVLRLVLGEKLSLREAGENFGLTSEGTRQILNKALLKLRHPTRKHILDGSRRQARIEAAAKEEREAIVKEKWLTAEAEIEQQKRQCVARTNAQLLLKIESLSLTPVCEQKLKTLGIETIGELLEKFPYDPQTNGLTGLTVADGIEKVDYQEIWAALFTAGLLIRMPELPDFEALQKAEMAAAINDGVAKMTDISIDDLDLSARSHNCLIRGGIYSVGDLLNGLNLDVGWLLQADRQEATREVAQLAFDLRIRNLCRKSVEEIADRLYDLTIQYAKQG